MTRNRSRAAESLNTRLAHAETCVEWRAPVITMPSPPGRVELLRRKAELEEAGIELALRISVFRDPAAVAAFEEIRRDLALIERDLAVTMCATLPRSRGPEPGGSSWDTSCIRGNNPPFDHYAL